MDTISEESGRNERKDKRGVGCERHASSGSAAKYKEYQRSERSSVPLNSRIFHCNVKL